MTTPSIGYRRGQSSRAPRFSASRGPGLFREELLGTVPARTMSNLFHDLRRVSRGQFIGEYPDRHSQGARLPVERSQGHGRWELYRVDHGLYVVTADCVYDTPRDEVVAGEGLIEFSLRLSGRLQLNLPGRADLVDVEGPALLMLHLPAGMPITERVEANRRDAVVSLYSSPQYLRALVERSGDVPLTRVRGLRCARRRRLLVPAETPLSFSLLRGAKPLGQSLPSRHSAAACGSEGARAPV